MTQKPRKPNSIRPAAAVALFDSGGNILLFRRRDNDKWTMSGGTFDFGESLTDCAIREVRKETGFRFESRV
jgi:ADP-ribose pyrophosphatase YjhB (NUDIX family)